MNFSHSMMKIKFRLSPPYYLALVFFIFIFPTLLHNMPIMISPSTMYSQLDDPCTKNFWVNLLYLNNYVNWKTEVNKIWGHEFLMFH